MLQHVTYALRRLGERRRTRLDLAYLASMDDHLLRDVGVHRGDLRARVGGFCDGY